MNKIILVATLFFISNAAYAEQKNDESKPSLENKSTPKAMGAVDSTASKSAKNDNAAEDLKSTQLGSPDSFVQNTSNRVLELLKSNLSEDEKQKRLTTMFFETTDADWIGKFVLGKYWPSLSIEDKKRYLKSYRKYLASSYVSKFRDYNNQRIEIKGIKELANGSYQVVTDIVGSSSTVRVEYRIKKDNSRYKIHDIIAEGVSLLTTQRSEFSSIMNSDGFEALIDKLESKSE